MFEIVQVTAQYSNAVLVAILPYVSDFAKKLELPVSHPITIAHVREFKCSPRADLFGGRVILTNGFDALKVVHRAIKKLGYSDAALYADRPPRITSPARVGKNYVPRYRVWWGDPTQGAPDNPPTSAVFEVDPTTGQIQML